MSKRPGAVKGAWTIANRKWCTNCHKEQFGGRRCKKCKKKLIPKPPFGG